MGKSESVEKLAYNDEAGGDWLRQSHSSQSGLRKMNRYHPPAPELQVCRWFNTDQSLTLESLRGRVVVLHAFQMLCPVCVLHGLPQAKKMRQLFAAKEVTVIGLHTVFEHHDVMTAAALEAFISEYRFTFPIAVDTPLGIGIPATMREYHLQGTPSVVIIDKSGSIRLSHFGLLDEMALGAAIGQLAAEGAPERLITQTMSDVSRSSLGDNWCGSDECSIGPA